MPSRIVDVLEGEGEGKEEGRPQPQGPAQVYQQARMALRLSSTASSLGPVLVGRDEERKKMTGFLRKHLVDQTSGAMYVSGQPGAGKTALLSEILVHLNQGDEEELASFRWATLNCMSFTDGTEVYKQILRSLQIPFDMDRIEREGGKVMEESFVGERRRVHFILGLDEVDQLLTISPSTLHHLFGLTARRHSRLILVGIANDLNMTDRLLPELQGQGCKFVFVLFFCRERKGWTNDLPSPPPPMGRNQVIQSFCILRRTRPRRQCRLCDRGLSTYENQ